jgi:hypothetical protein
MLHANNSLTRSESAPTADVRVERAARAPVASPRGMSELSSDLGAVVKMMVGLLASALALSACQQQETASGPSSEELAEQIEQLEQRAEAAETRAERAEEQRDNLEEELAAQAEAEAASEPETIAVGEPAVFGSLRFLILGPPSCFNALDVSYDYMENMVFEAQGQYCAIELQVENVGNAPDVVYPDGLLIDSDGRSHSLDDAVTFEASMSEGDDYGSELNPGQSGSLSIYFDIPRDVTPAQLQLGLGYGEFVPEEETPVLLELEDPVWDGQGSVEWQDG